MMKWLVLGLLLSSPAMAADNMAAPPVTAPPPSPDSEVTMRLSELQLIINAAAAQQIAAPAFTKLQQQIKGQK